MKKLEQYEIDKINLIKQDALEVASILGELQFQKISIDLKIEEQKSRIKDIKSREEAILEEIKIKYGNVTINIETGEISQ